MSLFLSTEERALIRENRDRAPLSRFHEALLKRASRLAAEPGLMKPETAVEWWHCAGEYLTDVAMAHALQPAPQLATWLAATTLDIVRRPVSDWIGPDFRKLTEPPMGYLETAHLSWAVAIVLDLAPEAFRETERAEIAGVLRERALPMCLGWLEANLHLSNWRSVMNAGLAVAAAVLDDRDMMERAAAGFELCCGAFQSDGSHAEGIVYGCYTAFAQMLTYEALTRRDAAYADRLSPLAYGGAVRWWAASLFYMKPLAGWGAEPRPRWANFNDAGATGGLSGDVLLHIAARTHAQQPAEAGLARRLFDEIYAPGTAQGLHDPAASAFVNRFGFLTLPLLLQSPAPPAPEAVGLKTLETFGCGDMLARDGWNGRTILAARGGKDTLHAPGHLHGDLNSFILVHNRERMLVDPGHSCYRNLIHEIEIGTATHNTCTFTAQNRATGAPETMTQSRGGRRYIVDGALGEPLDRGARRLLAMQEGLVIALASEAARLYGAPLREFTRFWLLCGTHALFIVDRIASEAPVTTTWHWLLNNRDGELDLRLARPGHLTARRGAAGMKLFHAAGGDLGGPRHAYVHDTYHSKPAQRGEGKPGSGELVTWTEKEAALQRTALHAIALDSRDAIDGWDWKGTPTGGMLSGPERLAWTLHIQDVPLRLEVSEAPSGARWQVAADEDGVLALSALKA